MANEIIVILHNKQDWNNISVTYICHICGHTHEDLQERWYCRHQGNGHCSERNAPQCSHGTIGGVESVTQHVVGTGVWGERGKHCTMETLVGTVVNKKFKGKILSKRIMYVLSTLNTLRAELASWDVWRGMIRKGRKPKRKVPGFSWSISWQPQSSTLCESRWKVAWAAGTHSLWMHGMTSVKNKTKKPLYWF